MRVLAIETSCDETAISILECSGGTSSASFTLLGNALFSQAHLHAAYGGVYPTLAKREHQKNLPLLLEQALASASEKVLGSPVSPRSARGPDFSVTDAAAPLNIDLIAVTQGPGLEPALWQGIEFAVELGKTLGVPVVGTDHMEGHIVSGLVEKTSDTEFVLKPAPLPLLALLISGGHTELVLMDKWFNYRIVGKTKDDAIGEAFDKVARLLGLSYPGGPEISKYAARARSRGATEKVHGVVFPRPMIHDNTCDFSFSGLKTAVLYKLRTMPELSEEDKEHVAHAFEEAAKDVVVEKARRALNDTSAHVLVVGGGVAANTTIREALTALAQEFPGLVLSLPDKTLTGDNAVMIGMAAYLRHTAGLSNPSVPTADGSQTLEVSH